MRKYLLLALLTLILVPSRATPDDGPQVLVVLGGHAYDTTEFQDLFHSLEGVTVEMAFHPSAFEILDSERIHGFDVLIFYDFIPGWDIQDSTILLRMTDAGIPMLFLHHSICNFQRWTGYRELVGGKYVMPEFENDSTIHSSYYHDLSLDFKILDPSHPVTRGVGDFTIQDEGYTNLQLEVGIKPLLGTDHPNCHPVVGWVNRYGRSTCVYLMMGHDRKAYDNPSFRQLVENSIYWLSRNH